MIKYFLVKDNKILSTFENLLTSKTDVSFKSASEIKNINTYLNKESRLYGFYTLKQAKNFIDKYQLKDIKIYKRYGGKYVKQ